jgi:uncharacterized membrane protein required for colicin V production
MKFFIKNKTPIVISKSVIQCMDKIFGFFVGAVAVFPFVIVQSDTSYIKNTGILFYEL